ncbi:hypothetical protein, partial [Rhodovulum visakhapatnamense]
MIGPLDSPAMIQFRNARPDHPTITRENASFEPRTAEQGGIELVQTPPEFMAMMAKSEAEAAWMDSAEGKAWQAEQLAKQNAQPVELAV